MPLAAALLAVGPALAGDAEPCSGFAWDVRADIAAVAAAEMTPSGSEIRPAPATAVRLLLVDAGKAGFALPPEQAQSPAAPAGTLRFVARAGVWRVTTTERLWFDVVQDGRSAKPLGFSGDPTCEGARKSVRFELKDGPATLQVSGSPSRTVGVAVTAERP
ncbi:hypothetical protein [Methylopila turkensis]|uniref:hypothetical protein n=1 Tax=Methylopila turkensis TaxID=1437816 RepID=UPI0022F2DB54|nr:hypothetical protein [Methylopila turkensis]